ncbi:unnamed protein product, partial [marine sediment metagenome]
DLRRSVDDTMNPITGEHDIEIGGQRYTVRFDWDALAEVTTKHGDSPNLFSPDVVASVASIGMKKHHPEMTPERIKELSPPLVPFAKSIQTALQYAYFGDEALPEDSKKKKSPRKGGLCQGIRRLFGKASAP